MWADVQSQQLQEGFQTIVQTSRNVDVRDPRRQALVKHITAPIAMSLLDLKGCQLSISKKQTCTEGRDKARGSVDPTFAAGLPFPAREVLECKAFRDSGSFFRMFPGIFPEFSLGAPEKIPETAIAFSSFLINRIFNN